MKWIGLTGGIATGKSTAAEILRKLGHPVINADEFAHQALRPDSPLIAALITAFGPDVRASDGGIDRKLLGAKIFADEEKRLLLESIVHPYVKQQTKAQRASYQQQGHKLIFYDVPLLFEKNMEAEFDKTVVVWCSPELQLKRLMARNSLSEKEARQRLAAQLPIEEKKKKADFVIENNSTMETLKANVEALLKKL